MTRQYQFEWSRAHHWVLIYVSNLFVPYGLAGLAIRDGIALIGMHFGVLMFGLFGAILTGYDFRMGRSLAIGSLLTTCIQCVIVPHAVLGLFSISEVQSIVELLGFEFNLKSIFGTFAVTMVMGFHLTTIAILFGAAYRWFTGDRPIWWNKSTSADPDME